MQLALPVSVLECLVYPRCRIFLNVLLRAFFVPTNESADFVGVVLLLINASA